MNRTTAINNIIEIPISCANGNKSFVTLLQDSGYLEFSDINLSELITALSVNEERVNDWFQWSADKRVDKGWFIIENAGNYAVGYSPATVGYSQFVYDDIIEACANFILKEIESCSQFTGKVNAIDNQRLTHQNT